MMNKIARVMAGSFAACVAFSQAALAGGNAYTPDPVLEDSGSDAGIVLLVAVGALLLIRALATPKPVEGVADATDTTE